MKKAPKPRNQLTFKSRLEVLEWVRRQPEGKYLDRTKAAEFATKELGFEVSPFHFYSLQKDFPGCIDRIVKRVWRKTSNTKGLSNANLVIEIQELRDRVAALESLVEMIVSGK